jgi:hypothetical protein
MNWFKDYNQTFQLALQQKDPIQFLNQRWGDPHNYYNEFLSEQDLWNKSILEIGSGLGRYTNILCEKSKLILHIIEPSMICRNFLSIKLLGKVDCYNNIEFLIKSNIKIDFVVSFSTFCHFNFYECCWYIKQLSNIIVPNGKVLIQYSSLKDTKQEDFNIVEVDEFDRNFRHQYLFPEMWYSISNRYGFKILYDRKPSNPIVFCDRFILLEKI